MSVQLSGDDMGNLVKDGWFIVLYSSISIAVSVPGRSIFHQAGIARVSNLDEAYAMMYASLHGKCPSGKWCKHFVRIITFDQADKESVTPPHEKGELLRYVMSVTALHNNGKHVSYAAIVWAANGRGAKVAADDRALDLLPIEDGYMRHSVIVQKYTDLLKKLT